MPDEPNVDNEIRKRISAIFPDEQTKTKMIDLLTQKDKPVGWSSQSYAPYYTPYFGEQMQRMVDAQMQMFNEGKFQEIVYPFEEFCYPSKPKVEGGCSEQSLYLRVNQSIRYVLEKLDTDGRYRRWRDMVDVRRDNDRKCVRVFIKREVKATLQGIELPQPKMAEPVQIRPKWKRELDDWIENNEDTSPFIKENLILSPQEQTDLKAELSGLTHIEFSVTSSSVKAIKVNV